LRIPYKVICTNQKVTENQRHYRDKNDECKTSTGEDEGNDNEARDGLFSEKV